MLHPTMTRHLLWLACCSLLTQAYSQHRIDTAYATSIGGIRQWIVAKGDDRSKPVLLWLHGGPGGSALGYAKKITGKLQADFVVVHWDQRGTNKTEALNASNTPTLAAMNHDVKEIVAHLLQTFKQERIYIVGNSWGGYLALQAARHYPQLLHACILVSGTVYGLESEQLSLQFVKHEANHSNNEQAIQEVAQINVPFKTAKDLYLLRKWLFAFHGSKVSKAIMPENNFLPLATKWLNVINDAWAFNPCSEMDSVACPMYFLVGKNDFITRPAITARFYEQLKAPQKQLYWFDTGHMLTTEEPQKMQEVISGILLKAPR
jgi:proline iminopeptidase